MTRQIQDRAARSSLARRAPGARPACELHQADAMRAHKAAKEKADAIDHLARVERIYDDLRPKEPTPPSCSCDVRANVHAALSGAEVPTCEIHSPAQPEASSTALNDDALAQALASKLGIPTTT